jgi:hypothetical protein
VADVTFERFQPAGASMVRRVRSGHKANIALERKASGKSP